MTPTEQDKELRALLGEMPGFVIDWLELSDDLRHEWKKGGKASDFGGQHAFIQKYEKKLADFITADRKRVALEARIGELNHVISKVRGVGVWSWFNKDFVSRENRIKELQNQLAELKAQQEANQ